MRNMIGLGILCASLTAVALFLVLNEPLPAEAPPEPATSAAMTALEDAQYKLWQLTQRCIDKVRYEPVAYSNPEAFCKALIRAQLEQIAAGAR